jgi:integrase
MTKTNSSKARPTKPYADFPLFPHATGRWAKKIRGRFHYFGPWSDPDGALKSYLEQKDDLHAGRTPQATLERLTLFTLCGRFLTTKKQMMDAGELSSRTYADYAATCRQALKAFGKRRLVADLRPDDFQKLRAEIGKTWGPVRLGVAIVRTKSIFRYGVLTGMMDRPPIYGEGFKRPTRTTLRRHRAAQGPKMFDADEVRPIVAAARQPLRAMILLGVNCGFGNSDCATLPRSALDLAGGWVNYPRPKTGIDRRCPLWPETVAALREWLSGRPDAKDSADDRLVFVTAAGLRWTKGTQASPISKEVRKLLDRFGIEGNRNFYGLRHTFQTVGDESGDFLAVRSIMGHAGGTDVADNYRERMTDERLRKVTDHVRNWVFAETSGAI